MTNNGDKGIIAAGVGFIIVWILGVLFSLGITGVAIWAIIKLVLFITG